MEVMLAIEHKMRRAKDSMINSIWRRTMISIKLSVLELLFKLLERFAIE